MEEKVVWKVDLVMGAQLVEEQEKRKKRVEETTQVEVQWAEMV